MSELVKTKIEDAVEILTISRPEGKKVNVLTSQVMAELDQEINRFSQDVNVRALVITGEGPYTFIAGADVKEIASIKGKGEAIELAKKGQAVFNKIENQDKPVICAINAVCLGGGMELALACHMRIASERAKLGQPEVLLGIIPGFGGSQRLIRLCGQAKARELLLTGDQISAKDAFQFGIVNQVVPENRLLKEAVGLAKKIADNPSVSVRLIQKAVREGMGLSLADGLLLEANLFGEVCQSEDMKEGVQAFVEKRRPAYKHR